ncbi:hypothetical protein [Pseudomonas sp.]|uniref:hypothetical protein n=1 Tax=Pseudomonas sp. TaxID=306 RepID=UPI001B1BBF9B|nr:hypothetical protein [Pseudomonas sp.]MBO9550846.1 hypothetical protein [Pseudomonas sp.]
MTEAATSKDELLRAVASLRDFPGGLRFDNVDRRKALMYGALAISAALLLVSWTLGWFGLGLGRKMPGVVSFSIIAGVFGWTVVSWWMYTFKSDTSDEWLSELSYDIAQRAGMIEAGIRPITTPPEDILSRLSDHFADYLRGDHGCEIVGAFEGRHEGERHAFHFSYFNLAYVNQRQERHGTGGGNYETRTVHDHFNRFSLVVEFPWVRGIAVRTDDQEDVDFDYLYETQSSQFEDTFYLTGLSRKLCARFAKPETLEYLVELEECLNEMNLEFSEEGGELCISFDDDNLLSVELPCDLSTPEQFYAHIEAGVCLEDLEWLLDELHTLACQHDNHLERPATAAH